MVTIEAAIDIAAPAERVWQIMADLPSWPRWNAGVAAIELHGPFAGGVRVTYRTEVEGPGAAEVGAGVSGDFPDVLAARKRAAETAMPRA